MREEKRSSSFALSRLLERWRAKKVTRLIGGKVLDAGCGLGIILDYLPPGVEYIGVDVDPNIVASLKDERAGLKFYCMDIQKELPEWEGPFDAIISLAVLEHLEDPHSFLRKCHDSLKPGGIVVITTPSRLGEKTRWILARFRLIPDLDTPGSPHSHARIFRLSEISTLLRDCGFRCVASRYFQFGMNQFAVGQK